MRLRVDSDDLEWILASEAKIPHNFYSDKDTRTLLIPKGVRITGDIRKKIESRIDICGNPYIEITSLEDYREVLAECRESKEDEARELLRDARRAFREILDGLDGAVCIGKEAYNDLKTFYEIYYEKIKDETLLRESIVNVMKFDIDKVVHITNVFFLAHHFVDFYNDTHIRNFNPKKLYLGFLLHDIAKPEHHYTSQKKYNLKFVDFDAIKVHPRKGKKILLHKDSVKIPTESVNIVYRHHQRPSGGYPDLSEGETVPHYVRLFSMPDMYEQMRAKASTNPKYTRKWTLGQLDSEARNGLIDKPMWRSFKKFLIRYDRKAAACFG